MFVPNAQVYWLLYPANGSTTRTGTDAIAASIVKAVVSAPVETLQKVRMLQNITQ